MKINFSFKNFKTLVGISLLLCFLTLAFTACNKKSDDATEISYSNIAGVNATENAMTDFYINSSLTNTTPVGPGQAVGYFSVLPTANVADFRTTSTSSIISSTTISCNGGSFYSVVLGDGNSIVTLEDDRTLPQAGKIRIRFLNMSTYLTNAIDFGDSNTGNKVITGVANKVATGYFEIDPSITSMAVYNAGSTTPLFSVPVALQAGHVYIFLVTGTANNTITGKLLTQL